MGASIAFWAEDIKVLERQSSLWVCKQAAPPHTPWGGSATRKQAGAKGAARPWVFGPTTPPPRWAGESRQWTTVDTTQAPALQ